MNTTIEYHTIASTGNSSDFGDATRSRRQSCSFSSETRGVDCGGNASGSPENIMDYITIASAGNATDFGDLRQGTVRNVGACSGGGSICGGVTVVIHSINSICYITITGNTSDFGDLTATMR